MKDATTSEETKLTVGLDLGDRYCQVCVLDEAGEVCEEGRVATRAAAELCHEVIVANPRKLRFISTNDSKSDRLDAEYLARVGRLDQALLAPLSHRSVETQTDLTLMRSRNALVRARSHLISHARKTTKSLGSRLPACSSDAFAAKAGAWVPDELRPALDPVLAIIAQLSAAIRALDAQIEELARKRYPQTALLDPGSRRGHTDGHGLRTHRGGPRTFPQKPLGGLLSGTAAAAA